MSKGFDRKIVLEDGSEFYGYAFGGGVPQVCELSFNTSMVGYQEVVSDPSYADQMVIMTYPLIGNYGIADEDMGNKQPVVGGMIVREYNDSPSNFRYTKTLSETLEEYDIPGIAGVDTRMLTRSIRDHGSRKVLMCDADLPLFQALELMRKTSIPHDQVSRVSCKKRWYARTTNYQFNVVAVDCGIKLDVIRSLVNRHCNVTVVPHDTTAEAIENMKPDGILFSNGPGAPVDAAPVIQLARQLRGKYPMVGIGLGCQILALAYGAKVEKLPVCHCGGSHPARDLRTGKVQIINQNHGYTVDPASLEGTGLEITHINVMDQSVEGIACPADRVAGVQFYPEQIPGSTDTICLYDQFVEMMKEAQNHA